MTPDVGHVEAQRIMSVYIAPTPQELICWGTAHVIVRLDMFLNISQLSVHISAKVYKYIYIYIYKYWLECNDNCELCNGITENDCLTCNSPEMLYDAIYHTCTCPSLTHYNINGICQCNYIYI